VFVTGSAGHKLRFHVPHAAHVGYRACAIPLSGNTILDTWGYDDGFGSGCVGVAVPVGGI
jgi:hypothetical protein